MAVDSAEILAALAKGSPASSRRRQEAVSCYLSASDGWQEASSILGGAFAPAGLEEFKAAKKE
ncbi:MAG: hypothetical protein ACLGHC_03860 [Alphaproteobacteria bacterium]